MNNEIMQTRRINVDGIALRKDTEGDGLTLAGVAVPFGAEYELCDGYREVIDPTCDFGARTVKLAREHGELIGRVTEQTRESDGLHITAKIADTQQGREVAKLIREGVYDAFSIGFNPVANTIEEREDGVTVVHRTAIELFEISVTGIPAYPSAKITGQRHIDTTTDKEGTTMEDTTKNGEIAQLRDEMHDELRAIKSSLAHIDDTVKPEAAGAAYRTAGDYLKALAAGDEQAREFMRETRDLITTADTGDNVTWIADDLKLIQLRRKVMGLLTHETLPPKGMTMEYNVVATDTTTTAKQAKEGDELTFGKVTFGTKTADINTYGGYTTLSRQTIERSTVAVLNTALRALTNSYAKATELAVRAELYALVKEQRDAASNANKIDATKTAATMTPNDWASLILDAAEITDERNTALGTLAVSKDVAKALIALTDTGSRFLDISGKGNDTLGSFDLTGVVGDLMRVPVHILPGAEANTAVFLDPSAVTVWESGGPTQLTDGDSIHLTESYSVYGYLAIGATDPNAMLPVKFKTA
ncbi:MAG: HK97 family phage prohead protease [Bifidobacterium animalis]|nr:HK97 family phage prohead protease [Bifidobacterium animalis]MDY5040623.1 HK97 family phage prohead protease [Bifidobacterium animalis]